MEMEIEREKKKRDISLDFFVRRNRRDRWIDGWLFIFGVVYHKLSLREAILHRTRHYLGSHTSIDIEIRTLTLSLPRGCVTLDPRDCL